MKLRFVVYLNMYLFLSICILLKYVSLVNLKSLGASMSRFAPDFVNYKITAANDEVYQLLVHGRWFSPGTPASSTTKTGCHDIAEILLKVALKHSQKKHKKTKTCQFDWNTMCNTTLNNFSILALWSMYWWTKSEYMVETTNLPKKSITVSETRSNSLTCISGVIVSSNVVN